MDTNQKILTPYRLTDLKGVLTHIDLEQPVMFDTETDGLYGTIELAQFYQSEWEEVLIVRRPGIEALCALLEEVHSVLQNSSYDLSTIQRNRKAAGLDPYFCPEKFDDTLYLGRLRFFTETAFSLDNLMFCALGFDPYAGQGLNKKELQKTKWAGELTEEQYIYAATDVYYLPDVWEKVKEFASDINYRLDMISLKHALNFQNHGMPVDMDRLIKREEMNAIKIEMMDMPINVNSYQQVRPYIGENESDALALARFTVQGNERAAAVNKTRKLIKQNSFLKKFRTTMDENQRIYGIFAPSARSGRFTCKDQNLEQLPRETKDCFGVKPGSGRILVYADFPTIQLRGAAAILGETRMAELFYQKEDLHSYTRDEMFNPGAGKQGRFLAKTCNFNLLFGGSGSMLGQILLKDYLIFKEEEELNQMRNTWRNLWPAIKKWQDAGIKAWRNGKADMTPMGRRYIGKLMTDHLNIKIQGAEADIAKLAMHYILSNIEDIDFSYKMCNFIHDSYIIECTDDPEIYKPMAALVGKSMVRAWKEMSRYFKIQDIPCPSEVMVGYNWGDIENEDIPNVYDATFN